MYSMHVVTPQQQHNSNLFVGLDRGRGGEGEGNGKGQGKGQGLVHDRVLNGLSDT